MAALKDGVRSPGVVTRPLTVGAVAGSLRGTSSPFAVPSGLRPQRPCWHLTHTHTSLGVYLLNISHKRPPLFGVAAASPPPVTPVPHLVRRAANARASSFQVLPLCLRTHHSPELCRSLTYVGSRPSCLRPLDGQLHVWPPPPGHSSYLRRLGVLSMSGPELRDRTPGSRFLFHLTHLAPWAVVHLAVSLSPLALSVALRVTGT